MASLNSSLMGVVVLPFFFFSFYYGYVVQKPFILIRQCETLNDVYYLRHFLKEKKPSVEIVSIGFKALKTLEKLSNKKTQVLCV